MKLGGLLRSSALILAVSSFVSQLLGFLRDKFLSYIYGAGFALDTYYAAFRVPEFMYLSIGSFVSSAILVPLFAKRLREDDAKTWFQKLFTTFVVFFIFTYGIILLFLPRIIGRLYGHTSFEFQQSIVYYGSILLFSTFFLSLSSIISSVAQEKRQFLRVGLAPVFYNLGTIIGVVLLRPVWGIAGVCAGVVVGSMLHLLVQLPVAVRLGLFAGYGQFFTRSFSLQILRETLGKSFLRTLSLLGSAVVFFLLTYFASLYEAGSITVITLAFTLQTAFHTLVGVSYATAVLPAFADRFVKNEFVLFDGILQRGLKKMFLLSFIITGAVYIFQYEAIYILFGGGNFTHGDVVHTAFALAAFSVSLYAQNAILLFSRAAYARGDYLLPLLTNASAAGFMYLFAMAAYRNTGSMFHFVWSVPVAFSLAQYLALGMSYLLYQKNKHIREPYLPFAYGWKIIGVVSLVSVTAKYVLDMVTAPYDSLGAHAALSLLIGIFYALAVYVLLGLIADNHVKEDRYYLKSKIKKLLLALFPKRG